MSAAEQFKAAVTSASVPDQGWRGGLERMPRKGGGPEAEDWSVLSNPERGCISVVYLQGCKQRGDPVRARIAKWGNSLGVRIPKAVAKEVGLNEGANVDVKVSGRNLVLAPAHREYSLGELVAGITPKNRHGETDWGSPVGNESW
jgi:antitoxin MazE